MQPRTPDLDTLPRTYYDAMIRRFGDVKDDRDYQELYSLLGDRAHRIALGDIDSDDHKERQKMLQIHRRILRVDGAHYEQRYGNRAALRQEIEEQMQTYASRVEKHQIIESYLKGLDDYGSPMELARKLRNMHDCHGAGIVGIRPDGGRVIAWDHKCNDTRMCPHAAWKESKRLIEAYHAAIMEQLAADSRRRIFYSVLTMPNVGELDLLEGKKQIFNLTKKFLTMKTAACPLVLNGHGRYKKTKPFSMVECVKGSLVTQEDPLGNNYRWHVHNNLVLITEGQFDYSLAREWWSELVFGHKRDPRDDKKRAVLHFDPIEKENLTNTLIEIIKYPVLTVGEKSLSNETAPAMTDWPPSLFFTWYRANQRFRRTRSYGCLYAIDRKRWDERTAHERYDDFFQPARQRGYHDLCLSYVSLPWTQIPEVDRRKLKRQMRQPNPLSLEGVRWVAQVLYIDAAQGYYVDISAPDASICVASTPGDNFLYSAGKNNNYSRPPPGH